MGWVGVGLGLGMTKGREKGEKGNEPPTLYIPKGVGSGLHRAIPFWVFRMAILSFQNTLW